VWPVSLENAPLPICCSQVESIEHRTSLSLLDSLRIKFQGKATLTFGNSPLPHFEAASKSQEELQVIALTATQAAMSLETVT
jgi:hypothetical protein